MYSITEGFSPNGKSLSWMGLTRERWCCTMGLVSRLDMNRIGQYSSNLSTYVWKVRPLLPSGNPFKCHKEVSFLQPMIPPKPFDIFFPSDGGMLRRF